MSYVSHVNLTIKANKEQSLTITCDILNSDAQILLFDHVTFECDKSHLIEAYYYYQDKECAVNQVTRELLCSGLHYYDSKWLSSLNQCSITDDMWKKVTIISLPVAVFFTIIVVLLITVYCLRCVCKCRSTRCGCSEQLVALNIQDTESHDSK